MPVVIDNAISFQETCNQNISIQTDSIAPNYNSGTVLPKIEITKELYKVDYLVTDNDNEKNCTLHENKEKARSHRLRKCFSLIYF